MRSATSPSPTHRPAPAPTEAAELLFKAPGTNAQLAHLAGPLESHLRQIEAALDVTIRRVGHQLHIHGSRSNAQRALAALEHFHERATEPLSTEDIQLYFVEQSSQTDASEHPPVLHTRRRDLHGRTPKQREYLQAILSHDLSFGIGPAGTGKTYLAVACAVDALERDTVARIILTRPAVEAGERLGFLPGDLAQKVDPYLRPLYDALFDLMGMEKTQRLLERQTIEVAPLAYMRGRTLNNAFIILDEAQNTTPEQMKMFLTRIGFGAKAVITGDLTQIDLPRGSVSGLAQAHTLLRGVRGISQTHFSAADVVRHPLVARIVEAYDAAQSAQPPR